jgi:hypothetical protein
MTDPTPSAIMQAMAETMGQAWRLLESIGNGAAVTPALRAQCKALYDEMQGGYKLLQTNAQFLATVEGNRHAQSE